MDKRFYIHIIKQHQIPKGSDINMQIIKTETNQSVVEIKGSKYIKTEDENNVYLKDISNNKMKINLTFSKNKEDNKEAMNGLEIFWTEVFL